MLILFTCFVGCLGGDAREDMVHLDGFWKTHVEKREGA